MSNHSIDSYSFGKITVDGNTYNKDLIVCQDKIIENWRREKGHSLTKADLQAILAEPPDLLIVGTGSRGILKVPAATAEAIRSEGIELVALPTGRAVGKYNEVKDSRKTAAALHLTC